MNLAGVSYSLHFRGKSSKLVTEIIVGFVMIIRNLKAKLGGQNAGFLNVRACGVYTDTTGLEGFNP